MIAFPIPSSEPMNPVLVVLIAIAAAAGFVAIVFQAVRYFRNSGDRNDKEDAGIAVYAPATGVDNVDVTAASNRGVLVVNAPGANSISVAEHAVALMLSLARSIPAAVAR